MPSRKSLRQRITIQQPVYSTDNYGQKRATSYTDYLRNLPASWEHTGGTEMFRGKQIEASVIGVFEVRMPEVEITPDMRVVYGGNTYDVHSARPAESKFDGGFRHMEIFVKALASG